jgi:Phage integrase family
MSELAVAVPTAGLQAGGAGTRIGRSIVVPKEDAMQAAPLLDRAGRRRSPATTSTFHQGVPPRNKGLRYPADPPTVDEIIAVMRAAGTSPEGVRLRGVIVVLWRAGLRISEALALNETDLDPDRGALLIRHGKGDKRREVGMDRWGWSHLQPWLELRSDLPAGRLFCIVRGPTRGRPCAPAGTRAQTAPNRRGSGRAAALRAPSAPARARGRDVPRRDFADRDPAPARPRRSRDHVSVSARYRQHRDHPSRASAARANDPGEQATHGHPLTR